MRIQAHNHLAAIEDFELDLTKEISHLPSQTQALAACFAEITARYELWETDLIIHFRLDGNDTWFKAVIASPEDIVEGEEVYEVNLFNKDTSEFIDSSTPLDAEWRPCLRDLKTILVAIAESVWEEGDKLARSYQDSDYCDEYDEANPST